MYNKMFISICHFHRANLALHFTNSPIHIYRFHSKTHRQFNSSLFTINGRKNHKSPNQNSGYNRLNAAMERVAHFDFRVGSTECGATKLLRCEVSSSSSVSPTSFMFVQLASFICANWVAGVSEFVLPNIGDVVADRFIFIGVLWKENARVTFNLVLA